MAKKKAKPPASPPRVYPPLPQLIRTDPEQVRIPSIAKLSHSGQRLYLGLDLGTSCGYAYAWHTPGEAVLPEKVLMHMGIWDLSAGPYDSGAVRFVRLRQFLSTLEPALVLYEQVRNTPPQAGLNMNAIVARATTSIEFFGALKGTLCCWAEERGVPCEGVTIQDIKRRATGRGNAGKPDIVEACNLLFGTCFDPAVAELTHTDDVADAAFCCLLALERYGKGLTLDTTSLSREAE